ncbi:MAG: methyltransferase domain-containing protein [Nocardioidaceae bacterium]|nr:methyltransferase domain-containing protein [Nocardioidaceae bacterium]NUS51615.1 methyltransferase domain-containing protein [Nocardioidaceae bacterium]
MSPDPSAPVSPPDFDAMYAADPDPWRVASSWYEQRKLSVLLASLPRERYRSGWEPGCGIGVATERLAGRVDTLVASDVSPRAVAATSRRVDSTGVRVVESGLPHVPVDGPVDLVVAAELLYYLEDLDAAVGALASACASGAHLVLLHWAQHPHDAFRSGPRTHAVILDELGGRGASHLVAHRDEDFVLDVMELP